ncbi:hypothetical protein, partial [Candidatus Dactylopiibacterium carminicum]|uniref:hypothetical protein n=1 Tax=Candidatus Dactylopiibacterium carminicum TaxID=857335 RepID=UPI001CC2DD57
KTVFHEARGCLGNPGRFRVTAGLGVIRRLPTPKEDCAEHKTYRRLQRIEDVTERRRIQRKLRKEQRPDRKRHKKSDGQL